jgi:hypothetical protein
MHARKEFLFHLPKLEDQPMKSVTCLWAVLAGFISSVVGAQPQSANSPLLDQTWAFGRPSAMVLKFHPCDSKVCAKVVALGATGRGAVGETDVRNPNQMLRSRPVCGLDVVTGLTRSPTGWLGGRAYNPADGSSVNVAIVETQSGGYIMRVVGIPFLAERLVPAPAVPIRPCSL